jgi:hypothetical protein
VPHPVQRGQELDRNSSLRVYQRPLGYRTEVSLMLLQFSSKEVEVPSFRVEEVKVPAFNFEKVNVTSFNVEV